MSNIWRIPGREKLAERLNKASFADGVFFTIPAPRRQCGLKLVRNTTRPHPSAIVITVEGAFHGRTLATIAAGGQAKHLKGFDPVTDGFDQVAFGNLNEMRAAITPGTGAILVEPVQGEGGMRANTAEYLQSLRKIADEYGLLLFFDEVQCGMGRTGKLFAHEWANVKPDIVSTAKGIGGGFPMGACLATEKVAAALTAGSHGSTFGGNPLAMAVGNAVLDVLLGDGFLDSVVKKSAVLRSRLQDLVRRHPQVLSDVRGMGLLLGVKCVVPNTELTLALRQAGLLTVTRRQRLARVAPLIIGNSISTSDRIMDECPPVDAEAPTAGRRQMTAPAVRNFLDLDKVDTAQLRLMLEAGAAYKRGDGPKSKGGNKPLAGKKLAMIFEKPSTRTRVSFEVGMKELGGDVIVLEQQGSQLGRGETVGDTARVLSRYVDAIMLRTTKEEKLQEMAAAATVPVINGLTNRTHPCQLMADVMTLEEHCGRPASVWPGAATAITWRRPGSRRR
jgi:acetylornithine/N-succinyldiaminopimelate aminotransferase